MINPNINGNRHQLITMQPNDRLVEGPGGSGKVEKPTTPAVDTTQQVIDDFNNGKKTVDELKAALDAGNVKYQDNGSTITFEYKNKKYEVTYKTETKTEENKAPTQPTIDVDQKLKDLEAKYNQLQATIKKNGGEVSAEMQKQLNEIQNLISQIKNEDGKNIDMGKLDLDLNSIVGYKTNTKNSMVGRKMNDGKALRDEAKSILDSLKDKMYEQLSAQAKSLGIPDNEFKTMFDKQFEASVKSTVNNPKFVAVNDSYIDILDNGSYKVKNLVDGFLKDFGDNLKSTIESWKDKNPNESVKNKLNQLENKIKGVDKEVTSDTNSKVTIDKNGLNLNNISGYSTNTKNKITGKALNNGNSIRSEAKTVLNNLKEALLKQLSAQAKALGIADNDFKKLFDSTFDTAVARAIDSHVNVLDLPGKWLDTGSYKVKDLVDGFLETFGTLINEEIVEYKLKH